MIIKIKVIDYIKQCDESNMAWVLLGIAGVDVNNENANKLHENVSKLLKTEVSIDTEKGEICKWE